MESDNYKDYWNEIRILGLHETKLQDEYLDVEEYGPKSYEDGEQEAEWLKAAGLSHLSALYLEGQEIGESDLEPAVRCLPQHQAKAVRRRVRTLNITLRGRAQQRHHKHRKPDIREVFPNIENASTGIRSRSETPDSLDSEFPTEKSSLPNFVQIFNHGTPGNTSTTASENVKESTKKASDIPSAAEESNRELFRRSGHWSGHKGEIASDSGEGILMLGFQKLGTLHLPRPAERFRSGSESASSSSNVTFPALTGASSTNNITSLATSDSHKAVSRSHSDLHNDDGSVQRAAARAILERSNSQIIFSRSEVRVQNPSRKAPCDAEITVTTDSCSGGVGRTWIDYLGEADITKLQNMLLLEVTALLDAVNIPFHKRKSPKRKLKEEGNVFGTSLVTLLERDRVMVGGNCQVPLVFQKLFSYLERYGVKEEGILRLAGAKFKVEGLIRELESEGPEIVDQLLPKVSCHDVVDVLKRLMRDLPTPLLTIEYIDMFYQTHQLSNKTQQKKAINLLILLLPIECRNLLRALFKLLGHIIENETVNRMSLVNVAMIIAPSLFNPRYIRVPEKNDLDAQVNMAITCCRLTEIMLECGDTLWVVPEELVKQIRRSNEEERYKKGHKENSKPMKRLLGRKAGAREPITRKIDNEVDFQEGVLRVNAVQLKLLDEPIKLTDTMTAGDVVLRVVEKAKNSSDLSPSILKVPRNIKSHALIEMVPNGSFNCFLATGDPEMTLRTHFLYEFGGNIAQRHIEHGANMLAVYKENPNARWILKCHHKTDNNSAIVPY